MSTGYTYKVENTPDWDVTVSVKVTSDKYQEVEDHVYEELAKDVKIAGFRSGKAPKAQVEAKLGNKLFSETINHILPEIASEIVEKEELNPITQVSYNIEKASPDSIEFSFNFANYPKFKLPDLTKLKVKSPEEHKVSQKDIDEVMDRLFKQGQPEDKKASKKATKLKITDKMVKELGLEGIDTIPALEKQITERIKVTKSQQQEQEYESALLDAAVKAAKIPVSANAIAKMAEELAHEYLHRIEDLNVDVDDFLKAQGLDKDKLKEQKTEEAKQKLQVEILLNQIAKEYDLFPTIEDIQAEIDAVSEPEARSRLDTDAGRRYILSVMINRKSIDQLKKLAQGKKKS